ncbi:hypothetical protein F4821DRAFT_89854 [Hypoxylon rubiginosum]|uniref:Uncharacterized protein n=1 Tax=Hypoxylon rubiginosum TaxID=110542 RepID=A0ACC0D7E3_9PEZI|nr:hypothetical protein F4821DRAFT_89854 [Hypoxylon rubiginosum]
MIDWDAMLLANESRWMTQDWRRSRDDLNRVPWDKLQRSTVDRLARVFTRYDNLYNPTATPELTPAHLEQLRRLHLNTTPTTGKMKGGWCGPSTPENKKTIPLPEENTSKDPGFLTVGYELELPIAVYHRGGIFAERPHPDVRGEAEEIVSDDVDRARVKRIVVDKVLDALNSQTDMVFIRKDADEGDELWGQRVDLLEKMDNDDEEQAEQEMFSPGAEPMRADPRTPEPTPEPGTQKDGELYRDDIEKLAMRCAEFALTMYYPCSDPSRAERRFELDKSLITAEYRDLRRAAQRVPVSVMEEGSAIKVRERAARLLELYAYQMKRDKRHVELAGMFPRYRAFSAYAMDNDIGQMGMQFAIDQFYDDIPEGVNDVKSLYGWELVKIASPVMRADQSELTDITTTTADICRVMRQNFRIHRDMMAIPTSTVVVVSHTNGFTLLELKKIITLFFFLERFLIMLNRKYRSEDSYQKISGSIKKCSPLGKICQVTDIASINDPENLLDSPKNQSDPAFVARMNEMKEHLPLDTVALTPGDRAFLTGIWASTQVTRLCKKATSVWPGARTNLAAQCRGGDRSEYIEPTEEDQAEAAKNDFQSADWDMTDLPRGVIKFRCAASSMDPMHIASWISVCTSLVDFAQNADDVAFSNTVAQVSSGQVEAASGPTAFSASMT